MNNRGFSLIEILLVMGLISVVGLGIASLTNNLNNTLNQAVSIGLMDIARRNMVALVMNDNSWRASVTAPANAPSMSCLVNNTPCTEDGSPAGAPITSSPFILYDGAGNVFYDASNPKTGMTVNGSSCAEFDRTQGSAAACPLRYEITWSANCAVGACVKPVVKVDVRLIVGSANKLIINPANYSVLGIMRNP